MAKRCLGCMKMKEQSPVCEHCGYNENVPNYPHQLPIGTVLKGQYTVGKVLGQGGFGITYIGWDTVLDMPVAIKEYYPNNFVSRDCSQTLDVLCSGERAEEVFRHNRERFLREARILAKLQNVPGIVRVHSLFSENNTAYIVMEYVEGIDLKQYIRVQSRCLTVPEVLSVMAPILRSLHRVHEAELVHRDISPDNIMILPDGSAKLLDFGAAREVVDADVHKDLPQSTEAILKHGFAPIEQYRRRGSLGPWTDVYGLAATMFYCLTGKVPNSAPERVMGDDNIQWGQVAGLTRVQMDTLDRAMAILPENRIQSMEALARGLLEGKAPQKQYPVGTVALGDQPVPSVMETKKKKKKPFAAIAAALALAATVGFFALKPTRDNVTIELPEAIPGTTETAEGTEPMVLTPEQLAYLEAEKLEAAGEYGKAAIAFGKLGEYEDARERSFKLWDKVAVRDTLSANDWSVLAIKTDGTLQSNNIGGIGAVSKWHDIVAVSMGGNNMAVGLQANGTVQSVFNELITQPEDYVPMDMSGWTDIVSVCAGTWHTVGLKADGTVVATGKNVDYKGDYLGQCDVSHWTDIVAVSVGTYFTVGLKSDGTVVKTGSNYSDLDTVSQWTDITAICAGQEHIIGLKSDGTVISAGRDTFGECKVSKWTDIVAVCAGDYHTLGLKADGTVVAVGRNGEKQCDVSYWKDVAALTAGYGLSLGLKSDGTLVAAGSIAHAFSDWTDIKLPNRVASTNSSPAAPVQQEPQNLMMADRGPSAVSGNEWEVFKTFPLLRSDIKRQKIMSVTFVKTLKDMNDTAWDISENMDGSVMAWVEKSKDNSNYYDLYIGANGNITAPENFAYFFAGYSNVRRIAFNGVLDTSHTTNMSHLFWCCTMLSELDVGYFDTSNVTDMSWMFSTCQNLWALNLNNFDTSKVTDMSRMFSACQNLTTLDVSSFDTSKVTNMNNMFFRLSKLQTLELQHFDTSKVTDMSWMFSECGKLWRLKVGTWETDSVTNYEFFFFPDRQIEDQRWQDWFEN